MRIHMVHSVPLAKISFVVGKVRVVDGNIVISEKATDGKFKINLPLSLKDEVSSGDKLTAICIPSKTFSEAFDTFYLARYVSSPVERGYHEPLYIRPGKHWHDLCYKYFLVGRR